MTTSADIRIRRIGPDDGMMLRDLRLRSIADAPLAFGQPIEEASARSDSDWHRSARQSSHGSQRTWLLAESGGTTVGLVQGRQRHPATLLLFSMWVDSSARRMGVGRLLVEALEAWGRGWQAKTTVLWVYGGNATALQFYRDLGFTAMRGGPDTESGARFGAVAVQRQIRPVDPGTDAPD